MYRVLIGLLVGVSMFASDTPKPTTTTTPAPVVEAKPPEVPVEFQSKIKSLVIRRLNVDKRAADAVAAYQAAQQETETLNTEGRKLEKELFVKLGLDSAKYATQTNTSGDVVIIKLTPPPASKEAGKPKNE